MKRFCRLIVVLGIALAVAMSFAACAPTQWQYGYVISYPAGIPVDGLREYAYRFAFRADSDTFDIDNVKITISFGDEFPVPEVLDDFEALYPEYKLYVTDEKQNMKYLIRHSNESFFSEEYRFFCERKSTKKGTTYRYTFNHSEEILIPKELFDSNSGVLRFCVEGVYFQNDTSGNLSTLCGGEIYYKKSGNTVVLSGLPINN